MAFPADVLLEQDGAQLGERLRRGVVQHGFSMALVFGVTRAHCVAFAERAPVNAGSWGMGSRRRWGALDEPVYLRSHESGQACPTRYLSPWKTPIIRRGLTRLQRGSLNA